MVGKIELYMLTYQYNEQKKRNSAAESFVFRGKIPMFLREEYILAHNKMNT